MKDFCQSPVGFAEGGAGLRQHDGGGDIRVFRQPLLHDHAADRMPDQNRLFRADLPQEILQGVRERSDADGGKRR